MTTSINFLGLESYDNGEAASFKVDERTVTIRVSRTLLKVWDNNLEAVMAEMGNLFIQAQLAKNDLQPAYTLTTDEFLDGGKVMNYSETIDSLNHQIENPFPDPDIKLK